jgi:uncharacterized membrane-anchored protein
MCSHTGQIAFVGAGEALVKQARDRQTQHRIAEEFEPLVVFGAVTAVRQCQCQQAHIGKPVAEAALQGVEAVIHRNEAIEAFDVEPRAAYRDRPSYLINRNTGAITSISLS